MIHLAWAIRYPLHHYTWSVSISESILNRQPVERIAVVRGPHLVGIAKNA